MNNFNIVMLVIVSWSIGVIMHSTIGNHVRYTDKLLEQCEKQLPRDKHCILVAVRKKK